MRSNKTSGGGGSTNTFQFVSVRKTANQTVSSLAEDLLTWDAEINDTSNMHDNATNNSRLTALTTGPHLVTWNIRLGAGTAGAIELDLFVNGVNVGLLHGADQGTDGVMFSGATLLQLTATDYVELKLYNGTAGNLVCVGGQIAGAGAQSRFSMVLFG